jgi:DNA-binding NarL/FixJ family response regulator
LPIRVILADDHPIVLHGLERMFESHADFQVAACCRDADAALAAVRKKNADVLVLDLRMPGRGGLDVLRTMAAEKLACRTLLLTAAIGDDEVVEAVRLGATGVVLKESAPEALLEGVRRVHAGEQWLDRDTLARAFGRVLRKESAAREAAQVLTRREIEIIRMIGEGLRNKAIADRLAISEGTVKIHLHNVYEKLGVGGRLELMLYAQRHGLV